VKIEDLARTVSEKSGLEPLAVRNVLETAFALLAEELSKDDKVELRGLGTFVRKQSRKSGKGEKTLFRSWSAAGAKDKDRKERRPRKARKKTQAKAKKENAP
jgi:nucleoid DNA-binding protein